MQKIVEKKTIGHAKNPEWFNGRWAAYDFKV